MTTKNTLGSALFPVSRSRYLTASGVPFLSEAKPVSNGASSFESPVRQGREEINRGPLSDLSITLNKLECFKQAAAAALNTISMG